MLILKTYLYIWNLLGYAWLKTKDKMVLADITWTNVTQLWLHNKLFIVSLPAIHIARLWNIYTNSEKNAKNRLVSEDKLAKKKQKHALRWIGNALIKYVFKF